jgi:hypothetical protein
VSNHDEVGAFVGRRWLEDRREGGSGNGITGDVEVEWAGGAIAGDEASAQDVEGRVDEVQRGACTELVRAFDVLFAIVAQEESVVEDDVGVAVQSSYFLCASSVRIECPVCSATNAIFFPSGTCCNR